MKRIKLMWFKFLQKIRIKRITNSEMKMMSIGVMVTEQYINSRKFRRTIKDTKISNYIEETLNDWGQTTKNEYKKNEN